MNVYVVDELIDNLIRANNDLTEVLPTHKALDVDDINHIFRTIHSLKGNAFYLDVELVGVWAQKVEFTLSRIRDGLTCSDEILNWLNNIIEQIDEWVYQLQNNKTLSYIPIFNKEPDFLDEDNSIVYDMQILYVGVRENIKKILKYKFPKYYATTDIDKIKNLIKYDTIEIIIYDEEVNTELVEEISSILKTKNTCTVGISSSKEPNTFLSTFIPDRFIFNTKKEKLAELHNKIFKAVSDNKEITNKVKRRMKLKIKYIDHLISNVTAMPESIRKIQKIIDDPEFKMTCLIDAIKSDPIATGIIFKESTNPIYNFDVVSKNIDRLIVLFGPKLILSILIKKMLKISFKHNLSPYSISISKFLELSNLRTVIVNKWINKNGYFDITDTIIAVFLASIGQYILSEDIMFVGKEELFKNLIEDDLEISHAEKQIAGYTTTHLSSILLENWEFKRNIHHGIMRTDNYRSDLKDEYVKKIATITSYMFAAIDQTGKENIQHDYSKDFEEIGLDLKSLEQVIKDFT